MRRPRLSVLLALVAAALGPAALAQAPAPGDVVVNEIMYDPPAPQPSTNEWVEVFNRSAAAVDLAGLRVVDSAGGTSAAVAGPLVVAPGGFAVFVANGPAFAAAFPGVPFTALASFPTLNNTGDTVRLTLGGADLDAVPYTPAFGGTDASTERRDPNGPSTAASNFGTTVDPARGTPGRVNSLFAVDTAPPALDGAEAVNATTVDVTFSEPVTAASAQQPGNYSVSGVGAPVSATLTSPTTVRLVLPSPLVGPATFTLTVSNIADAAGNTLASAQTTFFFGQFALPAPREIVVNEVMYDPPAPQPSGNEWVELFNRTADRTFDLAALRFADAAGTPVAITTTPTAFGPGAYVVVGRDAAAFAAAYPGVPFVQVAGFPTLNNDADTPTVSLADGTVVDAVPYRASWGGTDASLERKDPNGPSTSARNFATSVDPTRATPGRRNSVFAPDTQGPTLVSASVSPDGRTVTVVLDEPVDPATVTTGAFSVSSATVTSVAYDDAAQTVTLTLAAPLPAGTATVTAQGLRDLVGNTTGATSTTVTFAPDTTAPAIASATALSPTTVRVAFTEPVTLASAQNPAAYTVDGGIGGPVSVEVETEDGLAVAVTLTFAVPFTERQTYTITASGLTDAAGNTAASVQATFFFGEGDAAGRRDLVINEFLYDEPTTDNPGEYVELFNRTDRTFDLSDFTLNDGTGTAEPITTVSTFVGPGGYAVVVEDIALFRAVFDDVPAGVPVVQQAAWSALNNSGDAVVLAYRGTLVDSLFYQTSWGGEDASLERKDPNGPSTSARNFATTTDPRGGTPGRQNSQFAPDVQGPTLASATASPDGRTVTVVLDEPVDPATVTAGAFTVSGATVTAVAYDDAAQTVTLTLAAPLAAGTATVTATGLRDPLGNTTATTTTTVVFVPDVTPPGLARAFAETATTVRIEFTEPVTLASAASATYAVDGGIGTPTSVAVEQEDGAAVAVTLVFERALVDRQVYTLTVSGLVDLAGNTQPGVSAPLFFGVADTPAAGQLVVNEIMYDPITGNSEYVEFLNTTADRLFDLRTVTLDDGDAAEADPLSEDPAVVLPGALVVVVRNGAAFAVQFPGVPFVEFTGLSLTNSGEAIVLRSGGVVADSVSYSPDWHRVELDDATGIALERRDPAGPSNARSNWSSSLDPSGGTPGRANSLSVAGPPVVRGDAVTVTSPFAPDDGEAARITYTLDAPAALVRVRIFDGGGRMVREVEDGRLSGQTGTVEWDGTGDDRRRLRAGIYVVFLEAVDAEGGTTEAHRAAIVLARR